MTMLKKSQTQTLAKAKLQKWWHDATIYQIYPRSFCDANGDGIGDIAGIRSKLDYISQLGTDLVWLSPVYKSPMADNGYDIADYRSIEPAYGTMEEFDHLVSEAQERGIGIIMDLVVNHTSDQHAWFQLSRTDRTNPLRDFYIWRDPAPDGGPPNNMTSSFGGSAWTLDEATGQYYFHLFAPEQPDLNWTNPTVRNEIYKMMNWWFDKGIKGFRMDVIDLIGKDPDRSIRENGPELHRYLKEMHREALAGREVITVGETWGATPDNALLFCGDERQELDMIFQFEHVTDRWGKGGKWDPKPVDLVDLKKVLNKWQSVLSEDGWNSLYWGNHDLPRAVSSWGDDGTYRERSAKMLALVLHLMRGTPYIYQGEELGMTNAPFTSIDDYRDVETLNHYQLHLEAGMNDMEPFLKGARANGRDNARTPMQWSAEPGAGFTSGEPWIGINTNHAAINAQAQLHDPNSVFAFHQRLIALRKDLPLVIYGNFEPILADHSSLFAYERHLNGESLVVLANFTGESVTVSPPAAHQGDGVCLMANIATRSQITNQIHLEPYEAFAVLMDREEGGKS